VSSSVRKNRLLRILGVTFGLAVAIGILRIPGEVAAHLGNGGLIMAVWIVSGLYAFAGANTYAELGTMVPLDGGPYVFARRAYGEFGGFVVGWSDWILRATSMAYLAVALSDYSRALFAYPARLITPIAIAVLIFFTWFHWRGPRVGSRAQALMSLFKVIAFFYHHRRLPLLQPSPFSRDHGAGRAVFGSEAPLRRARALHAKHPRHLFRLAFTGLFFRRKTPILRAAFRARSSPAWRW
jgi:hypothetical protein